MKIRAKTTKLDLENKILEKNFDKKETYLDKLAKYGGAATSLIAVASLITSISAIYSSYLTWQNLDRANLNDLLAKLGSNSASERYFALDSILARNSISTDVQNSLYNSLMNESVFSIKIIMAEKIISKKFNAAPIQVMLQRQYMSNARSIDELEGISKSAAKSPDDFASYDDKYQAKLRNIEQATDSIFALAYIESRIACLQSLCGMNLSKAILKRYSFLRYPFSLEQSNFSDSAIWGADFYQANLDGVDFTGARITVVSFAQASLRKANFRDARIVIPPNNFNLTGVESRRQGYSVFAGTDLTEAVFDDACLGGANFEKAKGLTGAQFSHSYNKGAKFPPDIMDQLRLSGDLDREDQAKCQP
ncbi:pentapeptide repeat-containing protein [Rhizobium leguminosarum]|uniref:pentapeptide repeat-containing protein n=1 Tax=Rhizobium leguminosarum TaxID=384 RepID=UPI003F9E78CD